MSTATDALKLAKGELGYEESPAGSNHTKFGQWYGMDYQPWCAMFVTWCAVRAGSKALKQGARYSYVPYIEQDAKAGVNGLWDVVKTEGKPGDIITFDWDGNGSGNHVGFVELNLGGGNYQTIEGNTSESSNDNGGKVMRRTRYASEVNLITRFRNEGGGKPPPPKRRYYFNHHGPT
jgi:CHAP domain